MEKTIEEVGVGGRICTEEGGVVTVTKIEPNPILEVQHGKSVIVHYQASNGETGQAMCGTKTVVNCPEEE